MTTTGGSSYQMTLAYEPAAAAAGAAATTHAADGSTTTGISSSHCSCAPSNAASSYHALYTRHKTQKHKAWQDGRVVVRANRVQLYQAHPAPGAGDPVLDSCELLPGQTGTLSFGLQLELEKFLVTLEGPWTGPTTVAPALTVAPSPAPPSTRMQKVLTRKFRKPEAFVPARVPSYESTALVSRKRPLQPGELYQQYHGSAAPPPAVSVTSPLMPLPHHHISPGPPAPAPHVFVPAPVHSATGTAPLLTSYSAPPPPQTMHVAHPTGMPPPMPRQASPIFAPHSLHREVVQSARSACAAESLHGAAPADTRSGWTSTAPVVQAGQSAQAPRPGTALPHTSNLFVATTAHFDPHSYYGEDDDEEGDDDNPYAESDDRDAPFVAATLSASYRSRFDTARGAAPDALGPHKVAPVAASAETAAAASAAALSTDELLSLFGAMPAGAISAAAPPHYSQTVNASTTAVAAALKSCTTVVAAGNDVEDDFCLPDDAGDLSSDED